MGMEAIDWEALEIRERIKRAGGLTEEVKGALREMFPKGFERALEVASGRGVKRARFKPSGRIVWMVRGRSGEHQVIPEAAFCDCNDFYFRVIGGEKPICYHILAQALSEALGLFEEVELEDGEYGNFVNRQLRRPRSGEGF
jgi:predicted nucleic acid-binding Zn finger protein